MKKKLIVISCILALVLCTSLALTACANTGIDEDTMVVLLNMVEPKTKSHSASYTVPGELGATDAKGDPITVYVNWVLSCTDTSIYIDKNMDANGRYTVHIEGTITSDVSYTLKATLVNAKGKAYVNADNQPFSQTYNMKAVKPTSGGGGGTGDDQQQGGGNDDQQGGGGTQKTVTFVMEKQGFTDKSPVGKNISDEGITIAFSVGTGKTEPSYYTNNGGNAVRLYGGNTMTISGKTIVKVELKFATEYDSNAITVNDGTFTSPTWTGSTTSLVFTIGGTSGNRRITQIAVTYEE